jgi:DNA-binding winged helix-turn-helix (wHTH) protein/TolB-like protein
MAPEDALTRTRIAFGAFEADIASGKLFRAGTPVPIQDLPFRLLAALLERPGELVTRGDLTTRLWGTDTFVDAAAGLNTAVAKLREALGDDAEQPLFVETVPKRGYRFVGTLRAPAGAPSQPRTAPAISATRRRPFLIAAAVAGMAVVVVAATYRLLATPEPVRVAVVLFDNETGDARWGRLAQGLTDAVVTELTAEPRLAVIGNAAVLRTERPFRDIAKVRDALDAQYIVIGQVQQLDGGTIVRTHLIRAQGQAHVWVKAMPRGEAGEAAFQSTVAGEVRAAVVKNALAR